MSQSAKSLVVNRRLRIPLDELSFTFARSSGPGGQNVNKVNTKAILRWRPGDSEALPESVRQRFLARFQRRISNDGTLIVSSQRYRDQSRNVDDCLEKLRQMLAEAATPPKQRKKTRPPRSATRKRLEQKRKKSEKKSLRKPPSAP